MKINGELIERIGQERELHMLVKNVVILAVSIKELQDDMAAIKAKLGMVDEGSEAVNAESD
jgi:hypothetical protein